MEIYNEKIDYENPLLSLKIFKSERNRASLGNWHYHKELEILSILDGKLDAYVDDEFYSLARGDLVLIGSSQLHRDRSYEGTDLKYIVFQFDLQHYFEHSTMPYYRLFSESDAPFSKLNYILQENESARRILFDCVNEIYHEWQTKSEGYEIAITMLIKKIVLTLLRSDTRRVLTGRQSPDLIRLKPVLDYVEENINGKIQVETASRVANISYYYFVKYFKKALGMSFLEYVNFRKIKCAEKILLTRNISVAQVGEAVGMPNMAHFYKMFKKHNECSPSEFRKKMLDWSH